MLLEIASDKPFDAAVGRFILQFIPDPVAALCFSLSQLVRPGGVFAFQEVSYAPFALFSAQRPLWCSVVSMIQETLQRAGANTEAGLALHRIFEKPGATCANHAHGDSAGQRSRLHAMDLRSALQFATADSGAQPFPGTRLAISTLFPQDFRRRLRLRRPLRHL